MAINVSVQYNDGLLSDIILLTQCYYHRGTDLNVWAFLPLTGECSEGLDAFIFSLKLQKAAPLYGITQCNQQCVN